MTSPCSFALGRASKLGVSPIIAIYSHSSCSNSQCQRCSMSLSRTCVQQLADVLRGAPVHTVSYRCSSMQLLPTCTCMRHCQRPTEGAVTNRRRGVHTAFHSSVTHPSPRMRFGGGGGSFLPLPLRLYPPAPTPLSRYINYIDEAIQRNGLGAQKGTQKGMGTTETSISASGRKNYATALAYATQHRSPL